MDNMIQEFWNAFQKDYGQSNLTYIEAFAFGSGGFMADRLLALVLQGKKTATCSGNSTSLITKPADVYRRGLVFSKPAPTSTLLIVFLANQKNRAEIIPFAALSVIGASFLNIAETTPALDRKNTAVNNILTGTAKTELIGLPRFVMNTSQR